MTPPRFDLSVPGQPIPKQSAKFTNRGGFVSAYQPAHVKRYGAMIEELARIKWNGNEPLDGPLHVDVAFYMTRPASAKRRESPHVKPDLDNLYKPIMDAIESAGVIVNDSRVVSIHMRKDYDDGEGPRVEVGVRQL